MILQEFYIHFFKQLQNIYDKREAENISDWVFENIATSKRSDRVANDQIQITDSTCNQLNIALEKLLIHTPVQYVLGEAWFYKMKLKVNEHVLIPRPETEELVEWVVEDVRNTKYDVRSKKDINIVHPISDIVHILDIGTGSGCIGIALKKELPLAEIFAIDVIENALNVAQQNAADQNVKINFSKIDFLNELSWTSLQSFNIIVSNPPYIPEKEKAKLNKNVADHEPHVALFVPDNDPFIFYKKIASFAQDHLDPYGKIFVEIHEDYSNEVQKIFTEENFKTEIRKDIYGRERMIKASKNNPTILKSYQS